MKRCAPDIALASDGAKLAFQLQGPEDASALLLLQGQANSHGWWERLRGRFAARYRTITFDYRGTGATEAAPGDWTTESFADDAAAVLDHLGHETVQSTGPRLAAASRRCSRSTTPSVLVVWS
jgi:pimeloyl-ACP methyl ester carboxylesterase